MSASRRPRVRHRAADAEGPALRLAALGGELAQRLRQDAPARRVRSAGEAFALLRQAERPGAALRARRLVRRLLLAVPRVHQGAEGAEEERVRRRLRLLDRVRPVLPLQLDGPPGAARFAREGLHGAHDAPRVVEGRDPDVASHPRLRAGLALGLGVLDPGGLYGGALREAEPSLVLQDWEGLGEPALDEGEGLTGDLDGAPPMTRRPLQGRRRPPADPEGPAEAP